MDLRGKVVLITGGARRVGRAIAEHRAAEGARLAVHYHASGEAADEVVRSLGQGAAGFPADLRDGESAAALPGQVMARMGALDVVVNSAAVMLRQRFGDITPAAWDDVLNLNLRAAFLVSQAAAPSLRRARGKIVNISDVAGLEPWPAYLPHSVSKAGIEMLTRGLARVLAPDVTVNAVAPGAVLLPDGWGNEAVERTVESTPLGRLGSPGDVAAAVRFLLDADYVTGTTLVVDGGKFIR